MNRALFLLCVCAVAPAFGRPSDSAGVTEGGPVQERRHADEIDDWCASSMKDNNLPGMAVGVFRDGKSILHRTYGKSNLETDTPVTNETVFRIASMSKQFAASAIMLLVRDGKIKLDDRVGTHLPDSPITWAPVTIRHMLTHTSGIPEPKGFEYGGTYNSKSYFALFKDIPLSSEPGTVYAYSNHAYAALSLVVEAVSGKPMREFLRERVFNPLGMNRTYYFRMDDVIPGKANGYTYTPNGYINRFPLRPQVFDGSGGMLMTIGDYGKWDAALHGTSILDDATKQQMWTPYTLKSGKPTTYGFGWSISGTGETLAVSHNGSTFGFTSRVKRHVKPKLTVVIFQNGAGKDGAINQLEAKISERFLSP